MDIDNAHLEEKLKFLLLQLQTESGILDKIVYKGKNQHRHGLYFQYLLKVKRDVRLLLSAGLKDILSFVFQIISGKKPSQMIYLLESLKKKKSYGPKHNFQERLLGVARLLSEMVEPILKAATQISSLLARSFFPGFSITILALLARLRVLVQQILLDVISVFNMVASLSQKQLSVKFSLEGTEIFKEYFPPTRDVLTLRSVWKEDKFVLVEITCKRKKGGPTDEKALPLGKSKILYQILDISKEVPCPEEKLDSETQNISLDCCTDDGLKDIGKSFDVDFSTKGGAAEVTAVTLLSPRYSKPQTLSNIDDNLIDHGSSAVDIATKAGDVADVNPRSPRSTKPQNQSSQVAFISVRKSAPSEISGSHSYKRAKSECLSNDGSDAKGPFMFVAGGNMKEILF